MRLEYSADAGSIRRRRGDAEAWVGDGTLERRSAPAVYSYRHATASAPDEPSVEGIVVRVLLEPWGGGIRPHEHTMPGPKADRLALLHATRTQLSPILAVYFDSRRIPAGRRHARRGMAGARRRRADPPADGHRAGRAHCWMPSAARRCSLPMDTIGTRRHWPTRRRCVPTRAGRRRRRGSSRRTGS